MYSCKVLILQKEKQQKFSTRYFSLYITAERKKMYLKWKIIFKKWLHAFSDFLKDKGGVGVSWAKSLCCILNMVLI